MILRVIIVAVLLLLVLRAVRLLVGGVMEGTGLKPSRRPQPPPMKLARDPVCGTHVTPRTTLSLMSGGTTHYFCSEECRTKFRRP